MSFGIFIALLLCLGLFLRVKREPLEDENVKVASAPTLSSIDAKLDQLIERLDKESHSKH